MKPASNVLAGNLILAVLLWMAWPAHAVNEAPDCAKDREACIRLAVMETAAYVEECGKILPDSKAELDSALARWEVLKLKIPGVAQAVYPDAPGRAALGKKADAYLKSVGSYERDIECQGRLAMLKNKRPTLRSDTIPLPRNALEPYTMSPYMQ
ncbi:MAG: hypothetical protein ABI648_14320 [Betaproteobacteria bacterium]|jgi:hypothetical protein